MPMEHLEQIFTFLLGGIYAAFGGMVHFLYQTAKRPDHPFNWLMFLINVAVAFYVGQVAWDFLPAVTPSKGGFIMLAGFLAYPILDFFEKRGVRMIIQKVFGFKE